MVNVTTYLHSGTLSPCYNCSWEVVAQKWRGTVYYNFMFVPNHKRFPAFKAHVGRVPALEGSLWSVNMRLLKPFWVHLGLVCLLTPSYVGSEISVVGGHSPKNEGESFTIILSLVAAPNDSLLFRAMLAPTFPFWASILGTTFFGKFLGFHFGNPQEKMHGTKEGSSGQVQCSDQLQNIFHGIVIVSRSTCHVWYVWITKHSKPLPKIKSKVWGFGIPMVWD